MRIGIDLGGTKIEGLALDDSGAELFRERVPTPREYQGSLVALVALVHRIEQHTGRRGTVGIGIPGNADPVTGLVSNANSTWLIGQRLGPDLEALLDRPVRLMNDANCFALSEASDGAAAGAQVVFGVILGTGVGGGIVVEGRCLTGPNRIAGEWGHNPLPWPTAEELPGRACYCGKRGCIETFLSGPGFERDHALRTGENLSSREIVRRAVDGEARAAESLRLYQDRLGRALASVLNVLDPDTVVLGGGLSNLPGLADAARRVAARYAFTQELATSIVPNAHGDSSGVRGAAWLWPVNQAVG